MTSGGTMNSESLDADLVVIGGGGAGLAAAVAAAEKGANNIILLEARRAPGGNAALARGIFAGQGGLQKQRDAEARRDELFKQAMSYVHWKTNPRLVHTLIDRAGDTIRWLEEKGLKFEWDNLSHPNQAPMVVRISNSTQRTGALVVKALAKNCEDLGVRTICQTRAKRLLTDKQGKVTGVLAKAKDGEVRITAKSVIIATGGFAGNKKLLKKYLPTYREEDEIHLEGLPHQGDGLLMATEIGAATDGVVVLEMAFRIFPWSIHLSLIAKRPDIIRLNKRGERFTNEAIPHPESTNALYRQPGKVTYILFDEKIKQSIFKEELSPMDKNSILSGSGSWPSQADKDLQLQADKGRVKIADSWDEIAKWMGVAPEVLKATIDEYNTTCDQGRDDLFAKDRRYLLPLRTPPYYAIKCCINLLVTHGDIKINHHMEVLDSQDNPIPGLYAAGVDTGGTDSDTYNMSLPGHSFGFTLNSGRIAGENAAEFVLGK